MVTLKFKNPYCKEEVKTKVVKTTAKGYSSQPNGDFSFSFTACAGRHFLLIKENGTYALYSAFRADDPFDWVTHENEDFSVEER